MGAGQLKVHELRVAYHSDTEILRGVNLSAAEGCITAVIGPNGAGKSTLVRAIAGLAPVTGGSITLGALDVTRLAPAHRLRLGMALIPQDRSIFPDMTVHENLRMGGWLRRRDRAWLKQRIAAVSEVFPDIHRLLERPAGDLSGGQQKLVEIARGLVAEPSVLLLDEPTAGLSPSMASLVYRQLASLRDSMGLTILLVDQNIREALALSEHAYVLLMGTNDVDGPARMVAERLDEVVKGWMQRPGSGLAKA
jgi:ABC-type branched-subunit amino acid transport system ATPase component